MKKKIIALLLCLAMTGSMVACSSGSESSSQEEETEEVEEEEVIPEEEFEAKGLETDQIKISQYRGLEIDKVSGPESISDDAVEQQIQANLTKAAELVAVEDADAEVESGDTVNLDYVGKIDGEEFEGGSSEGQGYDLTIGSGTFIDGFEDSVIGHKVGDTYDWNGSFPDDYFSEDFAGKDVTFTITVNSISRAETPDLTDEFVKANSEVSETVDEYRDEVRKELEENAQIAYDYELWTEVWSAIIDNTEVIDLPEDEVEEARQNFIQSYQDTADQIGYELEDLVVAQGFDDMDAFEEYAASAAQTTVLQTLITNAIAEEEGIELSDEDYEEQLDVIANLYGYTDADTVKSVVSEENLRKIALNNLVKDWAGKRSVQVEQTEDSEDTSGDSDATDAEE